MNHSPTMFRSDFSHKKPPEMHQLSWVCPSSLGSATRVIIASSLFRMLWNVANNARMQFCASSSSSLWKICHMFRKLRPLLGKLNFLLHPCTNTAAGLVLP